MHQFRTNLGDFGSTFFGKRACLHCFLNGDTIVVDSEWHWIFDCHHFSELRMKFPSFHKTLRSIQNDSGRDYVDESDLARLLNMIISDSQLGFSLASFVRQAISERKLVGRRLRAGPPLHSARALAPQSIPASAQRSGVPSEF